MKNPEFWLIVIILGLFMTFVAYSLYFDSVKNIGATRSGVFVSLIPISGIILSDIILQEVIYWTYLVGLAFVIIGIAIINYPLKEENPSSDAGVS